MPSPGSCWRRSGPSMPVPISQSGPQASTRTGARRGGSFRFPITGTLAVSDGGRRFRVVHDGPADIENFGDTWYQHVQPICVNHQIDSIVIPEPLARMTRADQLHIAAPGPLEFEPDSRSTPGDPAL